MPFNDKENQSRSDIYNCSVAKPQKQNMLRSLTPINFSLTFNVGVNDLLYNASDFSFHATFIITIKNFKIVFPYMFVLAFASHIMFHSQYQHFPFVVYF